MMIKKIRLLPLSIAIMSLILGVRIVDFSFGVKEALAQTAAPKQQSKLVEKAGKKVKKPARKAKSPRLLSSMPTREEIEYLEKLSQRRQQLDRRARALNDRERLLKALELRITERTNTLRKIEQTINAALKRHDLMKKA
ncbi:MAG: hypothetical protein GXP02_09480, partial [Alphaproteobacteria bacterium]|nr:hypothetical protein [Alphaproteobacteria bacterium]